MTDVVIKHGAMENHPLISVIMNCYNSAQYLRESIDSVLAQTYPHWEIVFWDNQSTDESAEIFNSYSDPRLKYYYAPVHARLGEARNQAVMQARGEWVGFLDCDDIWLPKKLEKQVAIIAEESEDLGLVYGQMLVLDNRSDLASQWSGRMSKYARKTLLKTLPEGRIFDQLLLLDFIPLVTAIVRTELYRDVGGVSDHFEMAEDYDLFVKIAALKKARAVQSVIGLYRIHQSNTSILKLEKGFQENLEIVSRYLPAPSAARGVEFHYSYYALMKVRTGEIWAGVICFISKGRWSSLLTLFRLKLFRNLA
ncbi:glycosyltransferase family 2 protein [Sideroxydans sp.]